VNKLKLAAAVLIAWGLFVATSELLFNQIGTGPTTCRAAAVTPVTYNGTTQANFFDASERVAVDPFSLPAELGLGGPWHIIVTGPVEGSMDSYTVMPNAVCNRNGITLTIYVHQNHNYDGAALQNVPWRPRIELWVSGPPRLTTLNVSWIPTVAAPGQGDRTIASSTPIQTQLLLY
jgi:hypothetical protein